MNWSRQSAWCAAAGIILGLMSSWAHAGIMYNSPDSVYQENFDTLPSVAPAISVPWANDSTLSGWSAFTTAVGNPAMTQIIPYSGSGVFAGGLQSLGTTAADRALGSSTNGTFGIHIAAAFTNNASVSLDSFTVAYDGEQWRRGSNNNPEFLAFSYGFGDSFENVSFQSVTALNFRTPTNTLGTASGLNGNLPANRVANINATISGLQWVSGGDSLAAVDRFRCPGRRPRNGHR